MVGGCMLTLAPISHQHFLRTGTVFIRGGATRTTMPKLILIANRLPVTVDIKKNGEVSFSPSVGGLATGLSSLNETHNCIWIGFCGVNAEMMKKHDANLIHERLIRDHRSYSVTLSAQDVRLYYNGFSNRTIWPLFHYFTLYTSYDPETWRAYISVNRKFLEAFKEVYEEGDLVWVHDYHLMLLPGMIREEFPAAKIGFFLHIPFPSYEVFRLLPWRQEILHGILGSDLIGFHTFGYLRHFLNSVQWILGMEHSLGELHLENRTVKCDIFPMGIDYARYSRYTDNAKVTKEIASLGKSMAGKKMILSMDRLDFTKGIPERLEAYNRFLEKYPEFHEKVVLVMIAVPSRDKVETYIALRDRINELVGRINGRFSTMSWTPIRYHYRSFPFESIMAFYHCSHVALVTPHRDGMNLVAKEYVASRVNGDGVLILSEMAGSAEELGEALIVNPNNTEEIADAVADALSMDEDEQRERMSVLQHRLMRNDVFRWAALFVEKLSGLHADQRTLSMNLLKEPDVDAIIQRYRAARRRLILLDYDGTLVPFQADPGLAVPDDELISLLMQLAGDPGNTVAIISGRSKDFLSLHFSRLPITLIAEHGALITRNGESWTPTVSQGNQWKEQIRPHLEIYRDRTPGSFIEEKEYSLVWHYRKSDAQFAPIRAIELKSNLMEMVANLNLGIMEGNKVLEVKSHESSKGHIASRIILEDDYNFILAIGDDVTDEELFSAIPDDGISIKVGLTPSIARYHMAGQREVRLFLQRLAMV